MASQSAVSGETTQARSEALAEAYGAAWKARDVEAILALQTDDMVFDLHNEGFQEVGGVQALRELFGFLFEVLPDYHSEIIRTIVRADIIIFEYIITATLAGPFPVGEEIGVSTRKPMSVAAVDVMNVRDGNISRKNTYLDGFALRRGLGL